MPTTKGFRAEQVMAKLREAEKLPGQRLTIPQLCKRLQISNQTVTYVQRVGEAEVTITATARMAGLLAPAASA